MYEYYHGLVHHGRGRSLDLSIFRPKRILMGFRYITAASVEPVVSLADATSSIVVAGSPPMSSLSSRNVPSWDSVI